MRLPSLSCLRYVVNNGGRPGTVTLGSTQDERSPRDATLRKIVMCPGHQLVVAIVGDQWRDKVAVCRPGGDRWFVSAHDPWRVLRDIAFYDGKVYAVDDLGRLYARAVGGGDVECACTGESMALITGPARLCHMPSTRYLVVSGGKLFMVHRVLRGDATSEFKVFRFKADLAASRWVEASAATPRSSSASGAPSRGACPGGTGCRGTGSTSWTTTPSPATTTTARSPATTSGPTTRGMAKRTLSCRRGSCTMIAARRRHGSSLVMRLLPSRDARLGLALVCHNWRASVRRHQRRHPPAVAHLVLPTGMIFRHREPIEIENESAPSDDGPTDWRSTSAMTVQKLMVSPDGGGLVAAIVGSEYFGKVALCSLDTFAWSLSAHDRWRWYEDMAFDDDGKVYALTGDEDLLAFDAGVDAYTGNAARYLVRSRGGALLLVRRHFLADETTVWFSVFRADLGSSPPRWEEVDDLGGGEALFVGRHCSRAVRARGAVRGDQIFFLQDERVALLDESWRSRFRRWPGYHAGVYDMRERMITDILPQRMKCDGPSPTTWLFRDADGLDDGDHI
ncbi:unnamed protein product [Urochloa decumbens]|uniref:KIB1-4 beta-propeller domain-containing protein n=1 Tax=Urochloa decumbens TaxID=240449 RepID=A0ABC8VQI7_9POAL